MDYFILNESGEPLQEADVEVWTRWFETADRSVARTGVTPTVIVLTTFSGVDDTSPGEMPMLYETHVFGGVLDGVEALYPTREKALAGHAALVEWCRMGNSPDFGMRAEDLV